MFKSDKIADFSAIDDAYSDTLSRTNSSIFNDESVPVLGRRAQRMKQLSSSGNIYPLHCNLSDSDRSDLDTTVSKLLYCYIYFVLYLGQVYRNV